MRGVDRMKKNNCFYINKINKFIWLTIITLSLHVLGAEKIWFQEGAAIGDIKNALKAFPGQVNQYNSEGITGLMFAAKQSRSDMAQAFIDAGADLNLKSKDAWGQAALNIAAAQSESPEGANVFRLLVDNGAVVWTKDNYQHQPMHNLRLTDDIDRRAQLVALLVKKGANINAQDKDGNTLLHLTVQDRPWIEKMRETLWPLVDLTLKNKKGYTASQRAYELGQWSNSQLINKPIKKIEPNKRYPNGLTGLMLSVISGSKQKVERMLRSADTQVNLLSLDNLKNTALHLAVIQQHPVIANLLLDDNAKDSILNADGQAPIHLIVRAADKQKRAELVKVFYDHPQVNVSIKNKDGNTLLHLLVIDNDENTIQYMIKNFPQKIDVMIKNNKFQTPLMLAKKNKTILQMFN